MNATRDFTAFVEGRVVRGIRGRKVDAPKSVLERLRKDGLVQVRAVKPKKEETAPEEGSIDD